MKHNNIVLNVSSEVSGAS